MKNLIFIYSLFCSSYLIGQTSALLDTNNISATVNSNGMLFESSLATPGFEVPKGSGVHSIYTSNIWIGGLSASGELHTAAQMYGQNKNDFFYGPIGTSYTSILDYEDRYNKVWKVNKSTIDYHISNYSSVGYIVPESLANWPGNGNVSNNEAAKLAPYIDVNGNGTYDPINGDYPNIRGDQAIFYIVNDDKQTHTQSGGTKLGVEIHGMVYSYANTLDSALNQTVFVNFEIFNRSSTDYDSLYIGSFTDMDLGTYSDDYIGSDSLLNMFYTYNASNNDGLYGLPAPAQGVVFLNHPISKFLYFNSGLGVNGDPLVTSDYYNYLKGIWKDGSSLTYGNNGLFGATPANFMFSGYPELGTGWSEVSVFNSPNDRRGLMSLGPITLQAGEKICVDLAYPFARDYVGNNLTSVELLRQRVQALQTFYNSQGYICELPTGISNNSTQNIEIQVYPNPSNGLFSVKSDMKINNIEIMNILGELIYSSNSYSDKKEIDISNHPNGIYFYQIKFENDITKTGKIIKH